MMTCRDVRENIIQTTGFLGALSTLCGMCLLLKYNGLPKHIREPVKNVLADFVR